MARPAVTMTVDLSEFRAQLAKLSKAARGEALQDTVEAGGRVIEANAKINANSVFSPRATNALANSIVVEATGRGNKASANIGPTVVYGRIHELGGIIKPVHAKMLSWINEAGERVFAREVHMPARPYLRPAVDDHKGEIIEAMKATLARKIREALT
jgi:HK97 gp10 family phage protein